MQDSLPLCKPCRCAVGCLLPFRAAQGRIYVKSYNPQTQMPEFREYGMIQPQQEQQSAQYAPLDALAALSARVESIEQLLKQEAI